MPRYLKHVLLLLSLMAGGEATAQKQAATTGERHCEVTWKKQVMRRVYLLPVSGNRVANGQQDHSWPFFFEMLTKAAMKGDVPVYADTNLLLNTPLKQKEIILLTSTPTEETTITNEKTGAEERRQVKHNFDYDQIMCFRVLEDWSYEPGTGKTRIQILAIAPELHLYGGDDAIGGSKDMFWVKWNDLKPFIEKYKTYGYLKSLEHLIWASYFRDSSIVPDSSMCAINNSTGSLLRGSALRTIEVNTEPATHYTFNLEPTAREIPLSKMIYDQLLAGQLKAYKQCCDERHCFSIKELQNMVKPRYDTLVMIDPVTGNEVIKITTKDFSFAGLREYRVRELWAFDTETGITEISYLQIAPINYNYGDDGLLIGKLPFVWLKFDDIKPVLNEYAAYNPANNMELVLWDTRFKEKLRLTDRAVFIESR